MGSLEVLLTCIWEISMKNRPPISQVLEREGSRTPGSFSAARAYWSFCNLQDKIQFG